MSRIIVIGAGGHGRVIAEAAFVSGAWSKIVFLDDRHPELSSLDEYCVIGRTDQLREIAKADDAVAVAVGDGSRRIQYIDVADSLGLRCPPIVHPAAYVSRGARLGSGTVVLAKAMIGVAAHLGRGCIANSGCTIDHDCRIADGAHISPGANLAGEVKVGRCSWIGIGATVNQVLTVGDNVIVGASAAVIDDIPDGVTCVGVPARPVHIQSTTSSRDD